MTEPKLSSITENQAYASVIKMEEMLSLFSDAREIFRKADEARNTGITLRKENKPLIEENISLKEQKKQAEQEIVDINAAGEKRKRQLDNDESAQYALFKNKIAEWKEKIETKRIEYEALITKRSKDLNNVINELTKVIKEKELRNAEVDKEYNDVRKLFVSVGS